MTEKFSEKEIIIDFLSGCSVEVTPSGAKKTENFQDHLALGTDVYVTFLPGSDFADTMETVARLKDEGMHPIPHIAARSIPDRMYLENTLRDLRDQTGVSEALLIGGGVNDPVGDYDSSMQVLETGLFEKYGFSTIGVAGHPEGCPDIPATDVALALHQKNIFAKSSGINLYLATQFCFEADPIIEWERSVREAGNELPIHIGIPGLATIKTLIRHAQACGIGNSMRVLTRQARNITKLLTTRMPDKLLRDLAIHKAKNPTCQIAQCHLYPLGGLRKSALWMNAVLDGEFTLNKKGGFDPNIDLS